MTKFLLRSNSLPKTVGYDGTIKGVSVITTGPALGHGCEIDDVTLSQVVQCGSKGVPCKMDHSQGLDRIVGSCRNFSIDGNQVRADIQLLKSHEAYNFVRELIEKQPDTFGLSVSFAGSYEAKNKVDFVRCSQLYSVDFVDLPAANPGGLFNQGTPRGAADYIALATQVYPDEIKTLRCTCKDDGELSNRCARLFHFDGLGYAIPGFDFSGFEFQFGKPKPLFGMGRTEHAQKRDKLVAALAGKPSLPEPEVTGKVDPKLTGLAKAYSAHALATKNDPAYN